MVIFHGRADMTVPFSDAESLCAAVKGAGNRCELFGDDEATHGFFNQQVAGGRWFRETLLEADRYLTKLGYLRAVPEVFPGKALRREGTIGSRHDAGVAELADAQDLKSWDPQGSCGFDSHPRHKALYLVDRPKAATPWT